MISTEQFFSRVLIVARCTRCYRFAARYRESGGWERGVECRCDPVLPQGDDLARLVAQAHHKTITIRV